MEQFFSRNLKLNSKNKNEILALAILTTVSGVQGSGLTEDNWPIAPHVA